MKYVNSRTSMGMVLTLIIILLAFMAFKLKLFGEMTGTSNSRSGDWKFQCQRTEIEPGHWMDDELKYEGEATLALSGSGKAHANGMWTRTVDVEAGESYLFEVHYMAKDVEEPNRCILSRIEWQDASGDKIGRQEYPAMMRSQGMDAWGSMRQHYVIPEGVEKAKIELIYRWDDDGRVWFGGFSLKPSAVPEPRLVRVATVHYQSRDSPSSMENLKRYGKYVETAAEKGADIVCLPEGITIVGTNLNYVEASEPVPGPSTDFLGKLAKAHEIYIVAGIIEKEGEVIYNTAVLIDREGSVLGKYHKVSLPREEIDGGITPGDALPVFETDFGTIGMMICWDVTFPETARALAKQGAEVIFLPIWGGNLTLAKARAIENQVYLVSSTYDMKTAVFDQEGEIIAEATDENRVAVADIDLNKQKLWPWLGDFKNRIPREMPTSRALIIP